MTSHLDSLVKAVRAADPRLDDIARARVLHGIQRRLAEPAPHVVRRWRPWAVCAIACAIAATAAVLALRPSPAPSLAILRPYLYEGGPTSPELLIESTDRLTVGAGEVARADLAAVGRLTLRGPARLRVTAAAKRIELELELGQLFIDFDATADRTLIVRSPGAITRVEGTLFAVVAEGGHSSLVVARGSVEVSASGGRREVHAGQAFRSDGAQAAPAAIATLLDEHDHSALPPRGPSGWLTLTGAPATARSASGPRLHRSR